MRAVSRKADESGIALITALLVLMLISGLMAGMFAAINLEQRSHAVDRDQTQVYAAAHAGLEKLTADLAGLFVQDFSPRVAQLNALTTPDHLPNISGFEYTAPGGAVGSGYAVSWKPDTDPTNLGNPMPEANTTIAAGPYVGFKGLLTRYDITVTARSTKGSEVRLRRGLQTVAVPVFQFGVFSETDLTFYGGDDFDFGGRVHTNANLWLSEAAGKTLLFTDRITAYGDVSRKYLSNGLDAASNGMSGAVKMLAAIGNLGSARTMNYSPNEGSVTNNVGGFWTTATPPVWNANGALTNNGTPTWTTVSHTYYADNIINRNTGATVLRLPLVSQGATPIDLIRRPLVNSAENTANPLVFGQRYFGPMAGIRILLSDRAADITNLPTVTATAPIWLGGDWNSVAVPPAGRPAGYVVDATHPPIARAIGPIATTTVAGSPAFAAPYATIHVAALLAGFQAPAIMTVTWPGFTSTITGCTGRTITQFTGCNVSTTIPAAVGTTGTLTALLPSGLTVSTTTNITVIQTAPGANNRTITLNAPAGNLQPTARFVPGLIWVNGVAVTCEGYSSIAPARFTNCRGLTALTAPPPNGQVVSTHAASNQNTDLIGGFIKIEQQNAAGVWTDRTLEILNLGIGAPNQEGAPCGDPTPDAVIRIQRLRDNGNIGGGAPGPACTYGQSWNPHDWWPNALYDTREGNYRPAGVSTGVATTSLMRLGGVVNYVSLDVLNLKRWLAGTIPAVGSTGPQTLNVNGYIVYFSDRRGDHNENDIAIPHRETGEYGSENFVNPTVADGVPTVLCPAVAPQTGEDVNANGVLDCYGETPHWLTINPLAVAWAGNGFDLPWPLTTPLAATSAAIRPWTTIAAANGPQARVNRQVLFRRGLKLIHANVIGAVSSLPTDGLTVVSENPVYVQGNYNATNDPVVNATETHVPASIIADSLAILSNNWTDAASFNSPNNVAGRQATTTGYRFAVVTGKSLSFPWPAAGDPQFLFGTDGGAGNFLRMMEDWNNGVDLNYRGSMVSLYTSRQATGTFKYDASTVYDYADRNFKFDSEFLQPALLPPGTPMFRDVNLLTFRQILRPNQ